MLRTPISFTKFGLTVAARRSGVLAAGYSQKLTLTGGPVKRKCDFMKSSGFSFIRHYSVVSEPSVLSQIESLQDVLPKDKEINQELMNQRIFKEARLPANEEEYDLYEDINNLILERILPNIQEDGGDMEFRGFNFDNGTVFVKLTGACTSCSMSETTLKHGIEGMLTYFVPEVAAVKQVNDPEEEIALLEFEKLEQKLKSKKNDD